MIRRIVKMTFEPEGIEEFLKVFNQVKDDIRNFDGVQALELLNDLKHRHVFMTISEWESEQHLEKYRASDLFKDTWSKTKIHFAEKAEAWSLQIA